MKHETFSSKTSYSYWNKGNILQPTATQRPIWLESPVTWSCCFSATGSYVMSHFPLNNPSLHKTCNQLSGYSEGTERQHCYISRRGRAVREKENGSGRGREENPALLFTARAARSERVVWEGGGERVRKWEVGLMQAGVITYWDSGAAFKVCYIRLSPGLAKLS